MLKSTLSDKKVANLANSNMQLPFWLYTNREQTLTDIYYVFLFVEMKMKS